MPGIELRERGVQVSSLSWKRKHTNTAGWYQAGASPAWPRDPALREELDEDFATGEVRGVRRITFDRESGRVVMSIYLLRVGPETVEVSIFGQGKRGVDLEEWERWIGTIRPK